MSTLQKRLAFGRDAWCSDDVMRGANRPIAFVLLLMAVLCSPAGVCVVDGVAAAVAAPAHAHACCPSAEGPFLSESDGSCCEPRPGFVTVFRFTLEKQAAVPALQFDLTVAAPARFVSSRDIERRAPLVLRI